MTRTLLSLLAVLWIGGASAATDRPQHQAEIDLGNRPSLQRGARTFVNYCVSCHSAGYVRYGRVAADLGIPEDVVEQAMMFTTDKIGSTMTVAMRPVDAETWFGVAPPDLSVIARSRGADWLTSFMLGFYLDPDRPTGFNNVVYRDVAMPHVLWALQGLKQPSTKTDNKEGAGHHGSIELETVSEGTQTGEEYERTVRDLVNFLVYLGEPAKLVRHKIGFWVMLFLLGFLALAYLLKKEYWKDVH